MNGDSKSTNEKGPSLVGSLGFFVPVQESYVKPWLLYNLFGRTALQYNRTLMHTARNLKKSRTKPILFWLDIGSGFFQSFWTTSTFGLRLAEFCGGFFHKKLCQSIERKNPCMLIILKYFIEIDLVLTG